MQSLGDPIAAAKADPGGLNMGTMLGSSQHLASALFASLSGIEFEAIPYKGNGEVIQDILGNRLDFMFNTLQASKSPLESGMARALAVTSAERSPHLPDVPTIAESGVEGFSSIGWYGLLVPAGTPDAVVQTLQNAARQALEDPELRARLAGMGNEVVGSSPAEFDAFIRSEIPRWTAVIQDIGLEKQ